MFDIASSKCNACGNCIDVCPQQAIAILNGRAMINQRLCMQCGNCLGVCPTSAIQEVSYTHAQPWKRVDTTVYRYRRGFGRDLVRGGGSVLGFRGASPPWLYSGKGRGGPPRCWYPSLPIASPYPPAPSFYSPWMTREGKLDWLRNQAEAIKAELNKVEARMQDLEKGE